MPGDAIARVVGAERYLVGRFAVGSPTELRIAGDVTPEEWEAMGREILEFAEASRWWIGDWLSYGEWRYGEKYRAAIDATDLAYDYVRDCAYVASNVPVSVRRRDVGWKHHRVVAKLVPADQERWLARAAVEGWSWRQLQDEIAGTARAIEPTEDLEQLRFTIAHDRLDRWTAAAARVDATVSDWAIAVLDVAAAES